MNKKFTKLIAALALLVFMMPSMVVWGQVVSGTTYNTPSTSSLPTGWSGSDGGGTSYIKLTASSHYIQTSEFGQNGFTSIKLKARKFGGPTDAQAKITVSWYNNNTETVLGTITPSNTTLTDYTISSPTNPTGNTTGYIKIQCKGADGGKGSGVSQVTITYTAASGGTLYTVTFDAGDGTFVGNEDFPTESNEVTAGTYSLPNATKANYTLLWSDGTDTYEAGEDYEVTEDVDFTAQWTESGSGSTTTEHVYNFAGANNFYTDANLTTHPSSGSSNDVGTIYYGDGSVFVASGTSRYFSSASSGYFLLGATGAKISLPTFSGYKITQVKLHSSSGHSTSVQVSIVAGSNTASTSQTWSSTSTDYTYDIASDYQTSALSVKVDNNKNTQFTSITIVCQVDNALSLNVTTPDQLAYTATSGIIEYSISNYEAGTMAASTEATWISNFDYDYDEDENYGIVSFSTEANPNYSSRSATVTLTYTYGDNETATKDVTITQVARPTPNITAEDVSLAYNAASGSIEGTVNYFVAGATFQASTEADWITSISSELVDDIFEVNFNVSQNTSISSRSASVTLTYTYGNNQTATKDVTVTQNGDPNAINTISEITTVGSEYIVGGTVVAINARGFIIGDGTGYVYTYLGEANMTNAGIEVGDMLTVYGEMGSHNNVLQFTSSALIEEATSSNYNNTPAVTDITAVPDYSQANHLSTYLQFEGALEESNSNYFITLGEEQIIQISYPTTAQGTALTALDGKRVIVKGYFAAYNTNNYFTVMLESVEEAPTYTLTLGNHANVNEFFVFDDPNGNNPIEFDNNDEAQIYGGVTVYVSIDEIADCYLFGGVSVTYGDNQTADTTELTHNVYYSFVMPAADATLAIGTTEATSYDLTVTGSNITFDELLVGNNSRIVNLGEENPASICEQSKVVVNGFTLANGYSVTSVTLTYGDETVTVSKNASNLYEFTMPSSDATLTFTTVEAITYSLITNINQLVSGKHYIIASGANGNIKAMSSQNSGHYRDIVSVYSNNGVITDPENVYEFVINGPEMITKNNQSIAVYTIYDATTPGYLYASSSGSNYLETQAFNDNNGKWTISIVSTGDATINAQGTNTNNMMRFNSGSSRFACYGSTTSIKALPFLYMKDNDTNYEFYKDIAAHTDATGAGNTDGWYFIASPLASAYTPAGSMIANNTYDLYRLSGNTWENFKNTDHADFTTLQNGQGYLYANSANTTLHFSGAINTFTTEGDANVKNLSTGWNLIGNPYNIPIYINKPYYKMNAAGTAVETADGITSVAIPACTGVVVYAGENETVTFSTSVPSNSTGNNGNIQMTLAQQATNRGTTATIDNAIVSFNEGSQLGKFYFMQQNANLYIPQGTEEYAIVSSEAQGEMPVNFRANENGQYTLTVNPEGVEMNYLHLIDNMTGADIDLLSTPSYTFNANVTDYESRFKLVFASNNEDGASTGSAAFAFYSNGNWIINNAGEATLQVVDITGRILSSETVNGSVSKTINATSGVYMLRLINGENVKVQKIVVR